MERDNRIEKQMQIGIQINIVSGGYCRYGDEKYQKLREHGYSCVDIKMSDTESWIYNSVQAEDMLLHEKKLADDANIKINQVHGPWRCPPKDATSEDREERMRKMETSIRLTAMLGCKNWVIHPLMPFGFEDKNVGVEQKTWDININFMKELLKTAKKFDVTICIENMPFPDFSLAKPKDILRLVKEINDENLKICLDTGHAQVFDNELRLSDEVHRLGNYIKTLHVHDTKCGLDLHMMPFMGTIGWLEFVKSLKFIGYEGVFSLETPVPELLSDSLFEKFSKMYCEVAKEIISLNCHKL